MAYATDTALFEQMPRFPWRRPVRIVRAGEVRYGCRICMGLAGGHTESWDTPAGVSVHVHDAHPNAPKGPPT